MAGKQLPLKGRGSAQSAYRPGNTTARPAATSPARGVYLPPKALTGPLGRPHYPSTFSYKVFTQPRT